MHDSHDKVAFITGSGRRLGRQMAYALADAGYDIVLHAHKSLEGMAEAREIIRQKGRRVWTFAGDLARIEDIRNIGRMLYRELPFLDVLVNNAGVFPEATFENITPEIWDSTQAINTRAMFFLTQECAALLRTREGCVINMASAGGFQAWTKHIPYNVSKAGVVMLTKVLAKALAPGVRVNAIAPGIILVPGEEEAAAQIPADRIPLQRYGSIEDLTLAVMYLIEANYLTGHILPVDGGSTQI